MSTFPADGAGGGEAGSAQQIECEEGVSGNSAERLLKSLPCGQLSAAVKDTHRADNVFLCNKAGDGCHSSLPGAPAQRSEYPCDGTADHCEDGELQFIISQHPEAVLRKSKEAGKPYDDG